MSADYPTLMTPRSALHYACPLPRSSAGSSAWCIGPDCAAWVHTEDLRLRTIVHPDATNESSEKPDRPDGVPPDWLWCPHDPDEGEPACWLEPDDQARARRIGRCGMVNLR